MDLFTDIPKEVVSLILSLADFEAVLLCMAVSKRFYEIAANNFLWLHFMQKSNYKQLTDSNLTDYKSNYILEGFRKKYTSETESIFKLTELVTNLGKIVIPLEIKYLKNLVILNLSENILTTIPQELGQLVNLQYLYLHNNQLTTIPQELGQLVNLQTLSLYNNKLTTIPQEIGQLTNLQKLNLHINKLTTIPQELGQLTNLQKLDLLNNKLETIPQEVTNLKQNGCAIYL